MGAAWLVARLFRRVAGGSSQCGQDDWCGSLFVCAVHAVALCVFFVVGNVSRYPADKRHWPFGGGYDGLCNGGAFTDTLGDSITNVKLTFDETKLESCVIENGVLSASVAAENTMAVLGTDIGYDVDFMLTTGEGRVVSVVINYESDFGPVEAVISYN